MVLISSLSKTFRLSGESDCQVYSLGGKIVLCYFIFHWSTNVCQSVWNTCVCFTPWMWNCPSKHHEHLKSSLHLSGSLTAEKAICLKSLNFIYFPKIEIQVIVHNNLPISCWQKLRHFCGLSVRRNQCTKRKPTCLTWWPQIMACAGTRDQTRVTLVIGQC